MGYAALYRKFRPATFEEVKGQDHVVRTLRNQIKTGHVGHAYLFCGTRGTGKTSIAKLFAKAINCEHPVDGSPCGECSSCRHIAEGSSMNVIEIDAASNNSVDNIREIVEEVAYSPTEGSYKVYIIDEVHMLSPNAFNALLKTLEEPPAYVVFILATTEGHKILPTILSRCQRYDFKRIGVDVIADRLRELMDKEQITVSEKAIQYIAKAGDGSMRDALSIMDQCIAFHFGEELTYDMVLDALGAVDTSVFSELLGYVLKQDVLGCITLLDKVIVQGRELTQFVTDFIWYLRNLMLIQASDKMEDVIDMSTENLARLKEEASQVDRETILRYIRVFSELAGQIKYASQKRILTEVALIKLCKPSMEVTDDSVLDRVRVIEDKLENGSFAPATVIVQEPKAPVKRAPLPTAVPEDIRQAVSKWGRFLGTVSMPLKGYLKEGMLSLGNNDDLLFVIADGNSADAVKNEETHKRLEEEFSDFLGKEVKITIRISDSRERMEADYPDLTQMIQMDIEEEE